MKMLAVSKHALLRTALEAANYTSICEMKMLAVSKLAVSKQRLIDKSASFLDVQ
jgi:hypothetical protein